MKRGSGPATLVIMCVGFCRLSFSGNAVVSADDLGASRALLCGIRECSDYFVKTAGMGR
jgi:hypothetical protein